MVNNNTSEKKIRVCSSVSRSSFSFFDGSPTFFALFSSLHPFRAPSLDRPAGRKGGGQIQDP
jgi:hypothetical protein